LRVPLLGGAYTARSVIANAQRCVNLYAETNPKDAESPITCYPTPGEVLLATAESGPWRGLWRATNGECFGVAGKTLYFIDPSATLTALGTISNLFTPVGLVDNGATLLCTDGTPTGGWTVDLATHAFAEIVDPNFLGSPRVDYVDTFGLLSAPGTRTFYSTTSNAITPFNGLYQADKTAFPDLLIGVAVTHRDIWLIGAQRTEVWFNAGNNPFPFQLHPGAYIDHGTCAVYSICTHGEKVFWLSQDKEGRGRVLMASSLNYQAQAISTFAVEYFIQGYEQISDCIAFCYQQDGHTFVVFNFPSANSGRGATWVYDINTELWHERDWIDNDGLSGRSRPNCAVAVYGKVLVGDYANGNLYALDLNTYTSNGAPVVRRRGFPHLVAEGKRVAFSNFQADVQCGTGGEGATIYLRYSDDRGVSYSDPLPQSLGAGGEYLVQPQWTQLGYSRDRVFELFWSADFRTALQGAYLWPPGEMLT